VTAIVELTVVSDGYAATLSPLESGRGGPAILNYSAEASELGLPPGRWPRELAAIAADGATVNELTLSLTGINRGPAQWDSPMLSAVYEAAGIELEVWND
jgi:hypothetical protein